MRRSIYQGVLGKLKEIGSSGRLGLCYASHFGLCGTCTWMSSADGAKVGHGSQAPQAKSVGRPQGTRGCGLTGVIPGLGIAVDEST